MESCSQDEFKPKIGMEFDSLDAAWKYWIEYGWKCGFGVRKQYFSKSKKTGFITSYKYVCCKEGIRKKDKRYTCTLSPRLETRTNCKVRMGIRHANGKYRVYDFVECHNHPLHPLETVRMLASQRKVTDDLVLDGDQDVKHASHALFSAMAKKGNSKCETSRKRQKVEGLLQSKLKDTATKSGGKFVDDTIKSEDQSWNLEGEGQVDYAKASKDDAANISSHGSQQISKSKSKAPTNMSIRDRLRSIRDADGPPQHSPAVTLINGLPQSIPIRAGGARLQESVPSSSLHETPATEEPTEVEEPVNAKFFNSHSFFDVSNGDTCAQYIHGLATSAGGRAFTGTSYAEKLKLLSTYLAKATGVLSDVISDPRISHSKAELEALRNELRDTLIREKQLSLSVNKLIEEAEVARATHESLANKISALEAGNKKAEKQPTLVATKCSEAWQEGFIEGSKKFPCTEQGQAHLRQSWEEEKAKFLKSSEFLDHIQHVAFQYLNYGFDVAAHQAQEKGFTGLFDKDAAIDNAPELEGRDPSPSA